MKRLFAFLFLIAVAVGGWFVGSRLYAVNDLVTAAREGDEAQLAQRVDFPAFRESAKAEVNSRIDGEVGGGLGSVLAKAGAGLAIDTLVTPETVAQIVRTGQASGITVTVREDEREPVEWHIVGGNFTSFRLVGSDPRGALVFRRDGLGWRLAGIDLDE